LWHKRGRAADGLWEGASLAEAERRLTSAELPELVSAFLAASRSRRSARQRRARVAVLAVLAATAATALVFGLQKREADAQRTRAERREAEALRRAAQSAYARGELLEARALLRVALEAEDSTAMRGLWWRLQAEPLMWSS